MDVLVYYLKKYKFERLCSDISPPIVVHSVPGAGKSSLIREIIQADSRFIAYTQGDPDSANLQGAYILPQPSDFSKEKRFVLIDEYLERGALLEPSLYSLTQVKGVPVPHYVHISSTPKVADLVSAQRNS
jgi:hypothetical protein